MATLNDQQSTAPVTPIDSANAGATPSAIGIPMQNESVFGIPIQYANVVDGLSLAGNRLGRAEQKDATEQARRFGMEMKSATAAVLAMKGYSEGRATAPRTSEKTQRRRFPGKRQGLSGLSVAGATVPGGSVLTAAIQSAYRGGSL